jgi:hypothetical protein
MRSVGKLLFLVLLIGTSICASASDIKWTLSDVYFDNGNTATGYFITDPSLNVVSYSLVVSGPTTSQAFTAAVFVDPYLPSTIGFANAGFSEYVALYLTSPITPAGGTIPFGPGIYGNGFDCGGSTGCGTLLIGGGHTPELIGTAPEPATLLLVGGSLGILAVKLRRR